ncbi:hypothetical protein PENTCL1PPCAC_11109, partial [Pristionchus entomophagus]
PMFRTRVLWSYKAWNDRATGFLVKTKWGTRLRIGLLAGTVAAYPCLALLWNGPLVKQTFPLRHPYEELPEHLKQIAKKEYEYFLDKNHRLPKDAVHRYHLAKSTETVDTVAAGSLGVRSGLEIALPYYFQFKNVEEALEYFKKHYPTSLPYLGEKIPVVWDSDLGRELAAAFVMSTQAARFVVQRDMYAYDGWEALAQRSLSWGTWTTFTSMFTYFLHMHFKIFGKSAVSFIGLYSFFLAAAAFSSNHWFLLYKYMTDVHADAISARTSFDHCEGGKEYYWKQLKRNRIIREIDPILYTRITLSGDVRGIPTSLIMRYDHLKDVNEEDDELKGVVDMDD